MGADWMDVEQVCRERDKTGQIPKTDGRLMITERIL